jgi:hypothetical protein
MNMPQQGLACGLGNAAAGLNFAHVTEHVIAVHFL